MDPLDETEVGDIRFNDYGDLERFDGNQWQPYRDLPEDCYQDLFRNDPKATLAERSPRADAAPSEP